MSWDGSGNFTRALPTWAGDTGVANITRARHDTADNDLRDGINACLTKNGQNSPSSSLPMNSQKHTGVANASARTEYAAAGQIQDDALNYVASDSGSADAYVIAPSPAITAYTEGQRFGFTATNASTGASTINVSGLGVKSIKKHHDQAIAAGDIEAGAVVVVQYDGTNFQMLSQTGIAHIANLVEDTTPQLGGALDGQNNAITNVASLEIDDSAPSTPTAKTLYEDAINKMWCSWTTVAIQDDVNTSSITDNAGSGDLTCNHATAMSSGDHSSVATTERGSTSERANVTQIYLKATTSTRILQSNDATTATDDDGSVLVVGNN